MIKISVLIKSVRFVLVIKADILSLVQAMVCAIAELESDRLLLVVHSEGKSKERKVGLMQVMPKESDWLIRY